MNTSGRCPLAFWYVCLVQRGCLAGTGILILTNDHGPSVWIMLIRANFCSDPVVSVASSCGCDVCLAKRIL